jgi:ketosteroid isomerase-like protein
MSKEDVGIVRQIWDAWERRDNNAALALYDPDVEASSLPGVVGTVGGRTGSYRGADGLRRWMRDFSDSFDDFAAHPEEILDMGHGVVVRVRMSGRGKRSGAVSELVFWNVYKLRDGRVVRLDTHSDEASALLAAGLPK